jgi:hypothetical protein
VFGGTRNTCDKKAERKTSRLRGANSVLLLNQAQCRGDSLTMEADRKVVLRQVLTARTTLSLFILIASHRFFQSSINSDVLALMYSG